MKNSPWFFNGSGVLFDCDPQWRILRRREAGDLPRGHLPGALGETPLTHLDIPTDDRLLLWDMLRAADGADGEPVRAHVRVGQNQILRMFARRQGDERLVVFRDITASHDAYMKACGMNAPSGACLILREDGTFLAASEKAVEVWFGLSWDQFMGRMREKPEISPIQHMQQHVRQESVRDRTIHIWDMKTGASVSALLVPDCPEGILVYTLQDATQALAKRRRLLATIESDIEIRKEIAQRISRQIAREDATRAARFRLDDDGEPLTQDDPLEIASLLREASFTAAHVLLADRYRGDYSLSDGYMREFRSNEYWKERYKLKDANDRRADYWILLSLRGDIGYYYPSHNPITTKEILHEARKALWAEVRNDIAEKRHERNFKRKSGSKLGDIHDALTQNAALGMGLSIGLKPPLKEGMILPGRGNLDVPDLMGTSPSEHVEAEDEAANLGIALADELGVRGYAMLFMHANGLEPRNACELARIFVDPQNNRRDYDRVRRQLWEKLPKLKTAAARILARLGFGSARGMTPAEVPRDPRVDAERKRRRRGEEEERLRSERKRRTGTKKNEAAVRDRLADAFKARTGRDPERPILDDE